MAHYTSVCKKLTFQHFLHRFLPCSAFRVFSTLFCNSVDITITVKSYVLLMYFEVWSRLLISVAMCSLILDFDRRSNWIYTQNLLKDEQKLSWWKHLFYHSFHWYPVSNREFLIIRLQELCGRLTENIYMWSHNLRWLSFELYLLDSPGFTWTRPTN